MREGVYNAPSTGAAVRSDVDVRPGIHRRVSWAAVFAGVVLTLAIQIVLSMLGVGIGMTTIDPIQAGGTPQASTFSMGAGIWWTLSYMIALGIGGYAAARLAGVAIKGDGMLHGLLTWGFALLVSAFLVTSAVGSILGGALNVLGNVTSGVAQTVQQAAPEVARATGVSPEQLQQRAQALLQAGDDQQRTPEDAQRELVQNLTTMATGGQGADQARDRSISLISQQAGIPEDQARQRIQQAEQQFQQARQQAEQTATQAAESTSNALASAGLWGTLALVLGAVAAAVGGSAGTRSRNEVRATV
jgi:hypothetical protein